MVVNLPGDSPQLVLMRKWDQGFEEANMAILEKYLHKDYRKFTYPRSIGQPMLNREEWLEYMAGLFKFSTGIDRTIHSFTDAPGKLIIHVTNEAKNPQGLKVARESIFIMYFVTDDDGSLKVKQTDEFTDPKGFSDFQGAAKAVGGQ